MDRRVVVAGQRRILVRLAPGEPAPADFRPAFPAPVRPSLDDERLKDVLKRGQLPAGHYPVGDRPEGSSVLAARSPGDGERPDTLARTGVLVGATDVCDVRKRKEIERAWPEPLPYAIPSFPEAGRDCGSAPKTKGKRGKGVVVAIVERAWSGVTAARGDAEELPPSSIPAVLVRHGDRTVGTIRRLAPEARLGLFTTLLSSDPPTEDIYGAIRRAVQWLGRFDDRPRLLLVELQIYLTTEQLSPLRPPGVAWAVADQTMSPGGRVCVGPVDADPAVSDAFERAKEAGIVVIVPAGNGRRDIDDARSADGLERLGGPHPCLRVGAAFVEKEALRPTGGTNTGHTAVDRLAPGHEVIAEEGEVTLDAAAQLGLADVRWSGTSAAAAAYAGATAAWWSDGNKGPPPSFPPGQYSSIL